MENERELGWEDTIENDSEYVLLPTGEYPFTVMLIERARHTPSDKNTNPNKLPACNKAVVHVRIEGGELGTPTVKENLYLHSRCEGMLCQFFTAIGHRKHGDPLKMDWSAVPGCTGTLKVKHRADRNDPDKKFHDITLLEPKGPTTPTSPTQNASF